MPARGHTKTKPLSNRIKVQFTDAHLAALKDKADSLGMTVAAYVRAAVLVDMDNVPDKPTLPKKPHVHAALLELSEIHSLAMQIKKLGTNVNQIAKQANAGMVPVKRSEVVYMLNQHQLIMSQAVATLEKATT